MACLDTIAPEPTTTATLSAPGAPGAARPPWAQYLRTLRHQRSLTAAQAAARLGVTQQTWTGWETGVRTRQGHRTLMTPTEQTVFGIVDALGLTEEERQHLHRLIDEAHPQARRSPWQQRLREARLAHRMPTATAAAHAGVTRATYVDWESRTGAAPSHLHLRRLLPHLGLSDPATSAFMAQVPLPGAPVRAPRQPTCPPERIPAWSAHLTHIRLEAGLRLSEVDARLGQASVLRRFELGGWVRSDGRLAVPSRQWLDRIAAAIGCTYSQHTWLHTLADRERLALVHRAPGAPEARSLVTEALREARRAAGLSQADVDQHLNLRRAWAGYEHGHPAALAELLLSEVLDHVITGLGMCDGLAECVRTNLAAHAVPGAGASVLAGGPHGRQAASSRTSAAPRVSALALPVLAHQSGQRLLRAAA